MSAWIKSITGTAPGWLAEIADDAGRVRHVPVTALALIEVPANLAGDQVKRLVSGVLPDGRVCRDVVGFRRLARAETLRRERCATRLKTAALALRPILPGWMVEAIVKRWCPHA